MILALVNNKGGVGKTTTAVNLSAALARDNRQVLLIDLDSQASASLSLGIPRSDLHPSSADVVLDGVAIRNALRSTLIDGLDLLTGSMELANADLFLSELDEREGRLKRALHPIEQDYDFIILDCPPSLSLLSINATATLRTQPSSRAAPIASASLRRQRSSSTVSGRNVTTLTVSEEGSTGRDSERPERGAEAGLAPRGVG